MTNIDDCLAAFAVTSWANRPAGLAYIRRTIEAYLADVDLSPASQANALHRLFMACDELRLDSRVAIIIQDEIAERIRNLESRHGVLAARRPGAAVEQHG